jgi:hypothetical protein
VLGRSFSLDNVAALLGETPERLLPDGGAALGADLLVATPESGRSGLTAQIRASHLEIAVAGDSTWKPPAADDGGGRGHGLPMMRTFTDYVALEPSADGTTVRMSRIVR